MGNILNIDKIIRPVPHRQLDTPRDTGQYIIPGPVSLRLGCRQFMQTKGAKVKPGEIDYKPFSNFGGNRQNLEKGMRIIWIADKGYKFVQRDQSGAEALAVAHLCRKGKYRDLFLYGIKPHVYMALKLFPEVWKKHFDSKDIEIALSSEIKDLNSLPFWKPLDKLIKSSDKWPAAKRYYYVGKKVIHASSYGMRGARMSIVMMQETEGAVSISPKEGDKYINTFYTEFPEISEWHRQVLFEAKTKKQLRNFFGFPFNITNPIKDDDIRDLIAWVPQSTIACITRQAFIKSQNYIEEHHKNWHLLADTHDSLMGECPDGEEHELSAIMKKYLEIELASPVDGVKFRMRSEAYSGYNWSDYHETKNPNGLKEIE